MRGLGFTLLGPDNQILMSPAFHQLDMQIHDGKGELIYDGRPVCHPLGVSATQESAHQRKMNPNVPQNPIPVVRRQIENPDQLWDEAAAEKTAAKHLYEKRDPINRKLKGRSVSPTLRRMFNRKSSLSPERKRSQSVNPPNYDPNYEFEPEMEIVLRRDHPPVLRKLKPSGKTGQPSSIQLEDPLEKAEREAAERLKSMQHDQLSTETIENCDLSNEDKTQTPEQQYDQYEESQRNQYDRLHLPKPLPKSRMLRKNPVYVAKRWPVGKVQLTKEQACKIDQRKGPMKAKCVSFRGTVTKIIDPTFFRPIRTLSLQPKKGILKKAVAMSSDNSFKSRVTTSKVLRDENIIRYGKNTS